MGCGQSTVVQPPADAATIEFDRVLAEEKLEDELHFKLLCLGAGESGKSTIIKQLVFLHKQSVVSEEEKHAYVRVLHGNVLTCINTLIKESIDFGYQMGPEHKAEVAVIEAFDSRQLLTPEVVQAIDNLWTTCPAIASTYERRAEFWILEGCVYYFQHMFRFIEEDYSPTEEDIVAARKRTTGVVETSLKYGNVAWSVVDVGGQRSERRKWLNCFDNARGILAVNRMQESLKLFEETMANPLFAETPVFLILNKKDLFESLIETKPLTMAFPEYTGPQELRPCIEYIAAQFAKRLPPAHSKPMVLLMAARVKKDVQYCFEDVKDTLIDANRKGIKKATAKLESLREKYREEQVREMELKHRERQTVEGKQNQMNREEQEKKHLAQLKAAQAEKTRARAAANPNGAGRGSTNAGSAAASSSSAATGAAATGTTTTTAPAASVSASVSSSSSSAAATPTTMSSTSAAASSAVIAEQPAPQQPQQSSTPAAAPAVVAAAESPAHASAVGIDVTSEKAGSEALEASTPNGHQHTASTDANDATAAAVQAEQQTAAAAPVTAAQ